MVDIGVGMDEKQACVCLDRGADGGGEPARRGTQDAFTLQFPGIRRRKEQLAREQPTPALAATLADEKKGAILERRTLTEVLLERLRRGLVEGKPVHAAS